MSDTIDALDSALAGFGILDNGTWVSFNRADAADILAERTAQGARIERTVDATQAAIALRAYRAEDT